MLKLLLYIAIFSACAIGAAVAQNDTPASQAAEGGAGAGKLSFLTDPGGPSSPIGQPLVLAQGNYVGSGSATLSNRADAADVAITNAKRDCYMRNYSKITDVKYDCSQNNTNQYECVAMVSCQP